MQTPVPATPPVATVRTGFDLDAFSRQLDLVYAKYGRAYGRLARFQQRPVWQQRLMGGGITERALAFWVHWYGDRFRYGSTSLTKTGASPGAGFHHPDWP